MFGFGSHFIYFPLEALDLFEPLSNLLDHLFMRISILHYVYPKLLSEKILGIAFLNETLEFDLAFLSDWEKGLMMQY